ncbi:MAG TPA: hypothetical protein PK109_03795, partial [Candidatus Paceibacterota bacterium]|nr:hypothetical protein [Candidatus Paceibacterota bacterium]
MADTPITELVTLEDLKELLEENIALTKDTRKMLKRMRREAFIAGVVKTAVWAVLLIASFWLSAKFLEPYLGMMTAGQEGAEQDYGALFEQYK